MKKILIVVGVAFLIGYLFFPNLFDEDQVQAIGGYTESSIPYISTSKSYADASDVRYFAHYLYANTFLFPNGKVGKIPYFWNGKANNINLESGLDENFLSLKLENSPTHGNRYRPYGLDCSGYVVYVMWLSGYKSFPDGSQNMFNQFDTIAAANATTGDLAFIDDNGTTSHVGIISLESGIKYVYHSEGGNGIVKTRLDESLSTYFTTVKANPYVN